MAAQSHLRRRISFVTNSEELLRSSPNTPKQEQSLRMSNLQTYGALFSSTQHYVYYRVDRAAKQIEVLAVWSTKFGEPPSITTG